MSGKGGMNRTRITSIIPQLRISDEYFPLYDAWYYNNVTVGRKKPSAF